MSRKNGGYVGYLDSNPVSKKGISGVYDVSDHLEYSSTVPFNEVEDHLGTAVWMTGNNGTGDPYLGEVVAGVYAPHLDNTIFTDASGNWDDAFQPQVRIDNRYNSVTLQHQANRFWSLKFSRLKRNFLTVANRPTFNFGEGDFTVEFWYKANSRADGDVYYKSGASSIDTYQKTILSYASNVAATYTGWEVKVSNDTYPRIYFNDAANYNGGGGNLGIEGGPSSWYYNPFDWHHYCFVRNNGVMYLYVDGILYTSVSYTANVTPATAATLKVGADFAGNTQHAIGGLLCDVRISNVAERLGNFEVPAGPVTATANTVLILSSNVFDYGYGTPNSAPLNLSITENGSTFRWPETPYNYQSPAIEAAYRFINTENSTYKPYLRANIYPLLNDTSFTMEVWYKSNAVKEYTYEVPLFYISPDTNQDFDSATHPHGKTLGMFYNFYGTGPAVVVPGQNNYKSRVFGYLAQPGGNVAVKSARLVTGAPALGNITPYLETGEWHHMAMTYDKETGNVEVYVNGDFRSKDTLLDTDMSFAGQRIRIGYMPRSEYSGETLELFSGWMQDVTITRGVKYTANFVPSSDPIVLDNDILFKTLHSNTSVFQYYTPSGVQNFDVVSGWSQQLRYDRGEARSRKLGPTYFSNKYIPDFVEEDGILPFERYGSYHALYKTASTSGGDYGVVIPSVYPTNTSLDFDTRPFTFEAWVYITRSGNIGTHGIAGKGAATTGWSFSVVSNKLVFEHASTTITSTDVNVNYGAWNHVVAQRTGTGTNQFHMYVNGRVANVSTVASNVTTQSRNLYILNRRNPETTDTPLNGLVNNLRLSNVARYPVNNTLGAVAFTPSVDPFNHDANTCFLTYQYIWSDAESLGLIDLGYQMNPVAGPTASTVYLRGAPASSNKNWGIVTRDGSSGLLLHSLNQNNDLVTETAFRFRQDDFSVEFFMQPHNKPNDTTIVRNILDSRARTATTDVDATGWYIRQNPYGHIEFGYNSAGNQLNVIKLVSKTAIQQPVWYHICVQRVDGNLALYINGIKEDEVYFNTDINNSSALTLFESGSLGGRSAQGFYGYFYGLRICRVFTAYGSSGENNPEKIPVPNRPLAGDIPGCIFMGFDRPYLTDRSDFSGSSLYNQTSTLGSDAGGYLPVKVTINTGIYTGRGEYAATPYTPFQPEIMDWRHHYRHQLNDSTSDVEVFTTMEDDANDGRNYGYNFAYLQNRGQSYTIEGWMWVLNIADNNFSSAGTGALSTLSTFSGNTALGGGILICSNFSEDGEDRYGKMTVRWHPGNESVYITSGIYREMYLYSTQTWDLSPEHNYVHFIVQFEEESNTWTFWINGKKVYDNSAAVFDVDTFYGFSNYARDNTYRGLALNNGCHGVTVTLRAKYPRTNLFHLPEHWWNKTPKLEKTSALYFANNRAVSPVAYSQAIIQPFGYPKISKRVKNLGKPTIYLGQNSLAGAGGIFTASTPPWGAATRPDYFAFGNPATASGRDERFFGPNYNDFTIEGWFAWSGAANPDNRYVWELGDWLALRTVTGSYSLRLHNIDGRSYTSTATVSGSSSNIVFDHLVVQRSGSNLMLFVNGIWRLSVPISYHSTKYSLVAPETEYVQNIAFSNSTLILGADAELTAAKTWRGYFSDFRITRLARYDEMLINGVNTMVHRGTTTPALPTSPFKLPITEIR